MALPHPTHKRTHGQTQKNHDQVKRFKNNQTYSSLPRFKSNVFKFQVKRFQVKDRHTSKNTILPSEINWMWFNKIFCSAWEKWMTVAWASAPVSWRADAKKLINMDKMATKAHMTVKKSVKNMSTSAKTKASSSSRNNDNIFVSTYRAQHWQVDAGTWDTWRRLGANSLLCKRGKVGICPISYNCNSTWNQLQHDMLLGHPPTINQLNIHAPPVWIPLHLACVHPMIENFRGPIQ